MKTKEINLPPTQHSVEWPHEFSTPIINGFLNNPRNLHFFLHYQINPTDETKKALDQAFKQYLCEIKLAKYISTIIERYVIDLKKKNARYYQRVLVLLDQPTEGTSQSNLGDFFIQPQPYSLMEYSIVDIERAMAKLTPKQRTVLHYLYKNQYTQQEIAKVLGISQQAVSRLIKRALSRLRFFLKERI